MSHSLFLTPLFQVSTADGHPMRVSFQEILERPEITRFHYPIALMNRLALLECIGLLMALLEHTDQVPEPDQWSKWLLEGAALDDAVWQDLPSGFELFGDTAFMQMPNQVYDSGTRVSPIFDLYHPLMITGETAKGHNQSNFSPRHVCASCANLALYGYHALGGTVSKYWSAAQTKESLVGALGFTQRPLRDSVVVNLLHAAGVEREGFGDSAGPKPWVPDCPDKLGLNRDGSLPIESCLQQEGGLDRVSDFYFPFIRPMRLVTLAVNRPLACECCGHPMEEGEPCVVGFRLVAEDKLFGLLQPETREALQAGFIDAQRLVGVQKPKATCDKVDFRRMYSPFKRHPLLIYREQQEGLMRSAINARGFSSNFTDRRPPWISLLSASYHRPSLILDQALYCTDDLSGLSDNEEALQSLLGTAVLHLFGIRFKQGRDVDDVTFASHGFATLTGIFRDAADTEIETYAQALIEQVQETAKAYRQGLAVLAKSCAYDNERQRYTLVDPSKKSPIDEGHPRLLHAMEQLWELAFELIVGISRSTGRSEKHAAHLAARETLTRYARQYWQAFVDAEPVNLSPLPARYVELEAHKKVNQLLTKAGG